MTYKPIELTQEQICQYRKDGYLIIEGFLDANLVVKLADRVEPLFYGNFETGIFPDEWNWRPGLGLPDVTRNIYNAWKCDLTIAGVTLSAEIGRLTATLAGWAGARLAQDSVFMKVPGARAVSMHQDARYIGYINPREMTTCWIALDDTKANAGTIEYVKGSHKWPLLDTPAKSCRITNEYEVLRQKNYRWEMEKAAADLVQPETIQIEVSAGSCVIHHGDIWHGSGPNNSLDKVRRSIGVHTIPADAYFRETNVYHVFGRYRRGKETTMDEFFFPILWTQNNYRSPFLADYCQDLLSNENYHTYY